MELAIRVEKDSSVPIYVQLAERIRLLMHEGKLKPGDPMPTVRALAVQLAVNANTVARVYRELQAEGLLRLERGVGTFVGESLGPVLSKTDLRRIEDKAFDLIRLARRAGIGVSELSQLIESRWQEVDHVQS